MSEHLQMLDMLARILAAIDKNHDATVQLAEALAGVRAVKTAKVETTKAIEKAMTEPAAPAPLGDPVVEATPEAAAPTYEVAKKVIMDIGTDKARTILKAMGVARLQDLDPSKFGEFIQAMQS